MNEKRKSKRWYIGGEKKTIIEYHGAHKEASIMDLSAGGIKISLSTPINSGDIIYGKLDILSKLRPFFIKGIVIRVKKNENMFETVIEFKKIAPLPLA